jgi:hypothetical protein
MKKRLFYALFLVIILSANFVLSIEGINTSTNVSSGINNALDSNVQIPQGLQTFARVFFGITNNNPIDLSDFIVLIALWLGFLWVIHVAMEFVPFVKGNAIKWLIAVIVVLIISVTGAIREITLWYYEVIGDIEFLAKYPVVKLLASIVFVYLVFYGFGKLIGIARNQVEADEAKQAGLLLGIGRRRGP